VQDDYLQRLSTLSHGERKRTQIAVALWQEPEVLAVDEPSNHIDAAARDLLIERLAEYPGVGWSATTWYSCKN
jgi:macrolide transport system ATP-binding/permease protein